MLSNKTPRNMEEAENKNIDEAMFSSSVGMVVLENSTLFCPRMVAMALRNTKVNVLVLMPPAVEPELPPMNMKMMAIIKVGVVKAPMSTVLKPADRSVTDWNKAVRLRSAHDMPTRTPLDSSKAKSKAPIGISMMVAYRAILVLIVKCVHGFFLRFLVACELKRSWIVVKPNAPKMTLRPMMTTKAVLFVNKGLAKPSGIRLNPALVNADTA